MLINRIVWLNTLLSRRSFFNFFLYFFRLCKDFCTFDIKILFFLLRLFFNFIFNCSINVFVSMLFLAFKRLEQFVRIYFPNCTINYLYVLALITCLIFINAILLITDTSNVSKSLNILHIHFQTFRSQGNLYLPRRLCDV